MKKRTLCLRTLTLVSFVGAASAAAGCTTGGADDTIASKVGVTNRASSALIGEVKSIDGVYGAGCTGHTEDEPWSVAAVPGAALTHEALRVRRNDATCTLKLTHVRNGSDSFAATPAVPLSSAFAAPSAFNDDAQTAVDFYGSAKLGDDTFAGDFSIELLLSDVTNDGQPVWQFPDGYEHSFTVTEGNVPAPDFGLSTSDHTLLTDENDVVTTSSGYIQLVQNSHSAQAYAVVDGLLSHGMSPGELASQIDSAPRRGAFASPYRIQAADLDLLGVDLTSSASRSIILRNTDHGISSYQVFRLRFAPRPGWATGAWSACSAACDGGTQTRAVSCQLSGADVDAGLCAGSAPATSQACNEDACVGSDLGAMQATGSCGILGVLGPGFTLTAGATEALPVGTTIDIIGSGVANIGVFSVSGGTASVTVLSGTSRRIVLTSPLAAGATMAFRTTLSISVAFTLSAVTTLPDGYVATGGKLSGSVISSLVMCSST